MALADYCLRDELADEINVTDAIEDQRLGRAISDASRVIDAFCRQEPGAFAPQTTTRIFDIEPMDRPWDWRWDLQWRSQQFVLGRTTLDVPPLLSVDQLATDDDGDGVYETIWTPNTDYLLTPYNREVKRQIVTNNKSGRGIFAGGQARVFPEGQARVQVTGSWGITEDGQTPQPVRRACFLLSMIYYRRPTNSPNSSGLGGAAASIGYSDPDIAAILWKVAGSYREQWVAT